MDARCRAFTGYVINSAERRIICHNGGGGRGARLELSWSHCGWAVLNVLHRHAPSQLDCTYILTERGYSKIYVVKLSNT